MPDEKPALYTDPQLALEVMQKLKAACPEQFRELLLQTIGGLANRDLLFYSLGRIAGLCEAEASLCSMFGLPLELEESS